MATIEYTPRPVLQAVVAAATEATGATVGWLAAVVDDAELAVVAAHADDPAMLNRVLWQRTPLGTGTAGLVVQSGQPVALQPGAGGSSDEWSAALLGRAPGAVVCVPCLDDDEVVGALQLVDKIGGGAFSFDDVELATLLAQIGGVALNEGAGATARVPTPARLAADLGALAEGDPTRYAAVAQAIGALVGQA